LEDCLGRKEPEVCSRGGMVVGTRVECITWYMFRRHAVLDSDRPGGGSVIMFRSAGHDAALLSALPSSGSQRLWTTAHKLIDLKVPYASHPQSGVAASQMLGIQLNFPDRYLRHVDEVGNRGRCSGAEQDDHDDADQVIFATRWPCVWGIIEGIRSPLTPYTPLLVRNEPPESHDQQQESMTFSLGSGGLGLLGRCLLRGGLLGGCGGFLGRGLFGGSILVLVLGARFVAVLALGLAAVAFFGAAAFLGLAAAVVPVAVADLVLVVVALALVALGFATIVSGTDGKAEEVMIMVGTLTLTAAGFAAGLASFFASLTGPEGPVKEIALLNTGLQGLVEERVELGLGSDGDIVVCLDILLDSLSARKSQYRHREKNSPSRAKATGCNGRTYLLPLRSFNYNESRQWCDNGIGWKSCLLTLRMASLIMSRNSVSNSIQAWAGAAAGFFSFVSLAGAAAVAAFLGGMATWTMYLRLPLRLRLLLRLLLLLLLFLPNSPMIVITRSMALSVTATDVLLFVFSCTTYHLPVSLFSCPSSSPYLLLPLFRILPTLLGLSSPRFICPSIVVGGSWIIALAEG
ncbi:hypothetical protein KCU88_g330, partial [Aureobasidium melanogenum]